MEKIYFSPEKDEFYGVYYPNKKESDKVIIAMLGDCSDDRMVVSGAKWIQRIGCNVLAMSPDKQDYGHHNYPLQRFKKQSHTSKPRETRKSVLPEPLPQA